MLPYFHASGQTYASVPHLYLQRYAGLGEYNGEKQSMKSLQLKEPRHNPEAGMDAGTFLFLWHCVTAVTASDTPSLNNVRYKCYMKSSFNKSSNMKPSFPQPKQLPDIPKVYHQIQHWLGNKKRPED
ncbi:hypothetical protein AVEN_49050-1 [Araneus ventricosus]|uniref:Uncharacterized protein n=1 Tax=Araneus ventricosus TaxID=182803 RepID=A0A4Y2HXJ4_ARAVE|nr:hypothetical protein AVEN_49050-1 [Araneus ventricosus]